MSHPQNPQNSPQQPQSPQVQPQWSSQHQPPYSPHDQQAPQHHDPQQWAPAQAAPARTGPAYGDGSLPPKQPYGQKPPKQKKPLLKRWWFWLLVIIVVIAIGSALGGGGDEATGSSEENAADAQPSGTSADEKKAAEPAEEAAYGIGDTVSADDWEVTVASVKDGVSKVGDEYLGVEAQGQFVQIELSVKNTGSEPNYFFEDDIKLGDDNGNTYSADSEAGIYAAEDNILFLEEINPGNTAKGVLVFDVPEDVDANRLTFAGGLFSDPVEISLQ
ncbi:DUF4352 domain-containing protein [Brevibacterium spongiae]|uniref:DUF4352 domain-containing protein n=1 Tax=Brevibacterium spongiae TaxID=2909672 RepID=A0ABY5SS61_9MICO|nr:DUF4352 domain-containing protein [Brevibacterium spongiae]UVI37357.1 DUF4352 domain-containing protein [Brevibacterium spongiae]